MNTPLPSVHVALRVALLVAPVLGLAAGLGAYFGVRAASLRARPEATLARAVVEPGAPGGTPTDSAAELTSAARALTQEVRRLGETLDRTDSARRSAVPTDEPATEGAEPIAPADAVALLAALDRAVAAIQRAGERVAGPGTAGVLMPTEPMNLERLRQLIAKPEEESAVEHAFWSVQRVLDTYGRPNMIVKDQLIYQNLTGQEFYVQFRIGPTGFIEAVHY